MTVYHQTPRPSHVALFISGDGGWNLGVVDMARELASQDALVAGVDIRHYMKASTGSPDKCWDPGTDFAELGRAVEKRFGYTAQVPPVIVGYSSGATIVYAAMAQAPPHTFHGGLSLGFCPDLIVNHPICKGREPLLDPRSAGQGGRLPARSPGRPLAGLPGGRRPDLHPGGHPDLSQEGAERRAGLAPQGGARLLGAEELDAPVQGRLHARGPVRGRAC